MSYEVAQSVLDQLAIATEIFTAGYVGVNFMLYSWKRLGEAPEPIAPPQQPLALPEAVATPLPELREKRELEVVPAAPMEDYATPTQAASFDPVKPPSLYPPAPSVTEDEDLAVPFAEDEEEVAELLPPPVALIALPVDDTPAIAPIIATPEALEPAAIAPEAIGFSDGEAGHPAEADSRPLDIPPKLANAEPSELASPTQSAAPETAEAAED